MEYQPIIPPFEMKPFKEMDKKEAQQYFDWYVNQISNRIELLKNFFEYSGELKEVLDFSPESLRAIWAWFIPQIKKELKTKEEIQLQLEKYPNWLKNEILKNKYKLSTSTLIIAEDISIYLAEVIIRNMKNIKWGFVTKPKSYISVNQPVLLWFKNKTPMEPNHTLGVLCSKVMDGEKNPNSLFGVFDYWKQYEVD